MKYLAALLCLFSQMALAERCVDNNTYFECFGNGTETNPSLSVGNQRTGIYSNGNGDLRFAVLGVQVARFDMKEGWVVPATTSKAVDAGYIRITIGVDGNGGIFITDDDVAGARPWAINSTSAANSQITGGLNSTPIGQITPAPGAFTTGTFTTGTFAVVDAATVKAGELKLNGNLFVSTTEPTIVSGFGDSPSVNHSNGSASFTVLVSGTGGSSRGVIGMPKAKNGWACSAADVSAPDRSMTQQTGSSPTSVTLTNYIRTTGIPGNWSQNDLIEVTCFPN